MPTDSSLQDLIFQKNNYVQKRLSHASRSLLPTNLPSSIDRQQSLPGLLQRKDETKRHYWCLSVVLDATSRSLVGLSDAGCIESPT